MFQKNIVSGSGKCRARPLSSRDRRADTVDDGENVQQLSSLPGLRLQHATGNTGNTGNAVYYTRVTPGCTCGI